MTPEEQAAAEAAAAASQQTPEEIAAAQAAAAKQPYTPDELKALTPTSEIDMARVPEPFRPVIENMTRDYKELQSGYTKTAQELAEFKKTPEPEQSYFDDPKKDGVFKDYLKNPIKVLGDINNEIANLESVVPDDGVEEFRKARRQIAYWNGIKDEFGIKKAEIFEKRRETEVSESKLNTELGVDAATMIKHAESLGFTKRDLMARPELRDGIKKLYLMANPGKGKEVKPIPQKAVKPSGEAGGGGGGLDEEDETNLPVAERIAREEKRKGHR